jgi:hypothetical protein
MYLLLLQWLKLIGWKEGDDFEEDDPVPCIRCQFKKHIY